MGVACLLCVLSKYGMASVGVDWCVYDSEGVACPGIASGHDMVWHGSVDVPWPQWMSHGLSGCDITSMGVTLAQWVWYGLSGCGMASVDVFMALVGVAWPRWA